MEALLFLLDAAGLVVMVLMVVRNERREPGEPQFGPFRYVETRARQKPLPSRWSAR